MCFGGDLVTPGATAQERLLFALADALERHQWIPCSTGDGWTSDDAEERAIAAQLCDGCPVWAACDAAGAGEAWGIWAGQWRGPAPTTRKGKSA